MADIGGEKIKINFSYESHFSRMSGAFANSYWCFGNEQKYMAIKNGEGIRVLAIGKREQRKQEHKLSKEMFLSFNKRAWLYIL